MILKYKDICRQTLLSLTAYAICSATHVVYKYTYGLKPLRAYRSY